MISHLRIVPAVAVILLSGLGPTQAAHAQKTDVIKIINGDVITGEIMSVSGGKLDYKTDDAGRLTIKWTKVLRVTSRHYFEVETSSGRKYFGQLQPAAEDGRVVVVLDRADTLPIDEIVQIVPLDSRFVDRLKSYLDVGFSLAKANKAVNLNVNTEVAYRGSKWGATVDGSTYFQTQENVPSTSRGDLSLRGQRFLPHRWQADVFSKGEWNDELGLILRLTIGAAGGWVVKQTNSGELETVAGMAVTQERFALTDTTAGASPDTLKRNLEGLLGLTWTAFRLDTPKLDFATSLNTYPSLTTLGRVRADLTLRVTYEVLRDFNVGLNFTDNFDSKPPDEAASKNDFVTSLTIGWSYRR